MIHSFIKKQQQADLSKRSMTTSSSFASKAARKETCDARQVSGFQQLRRQETFDV